MKTVKASLALARLMTVAIAVSMSGVLIGQPPTCARRGFGGSAMLSRLQIGQCASGGLLLLHFVSLVRLSCPYGAVPEQFLCLRENRARWAEIGSRSVPFCGRSSRYGRRARRASKRSAQGSIVDRAERRDLFRNARAIRLRAADFSRNVRIFRVFVELLR